MNTYKIILCSLVFSMLANISFSQEKDKGMDEMWGETTVMSDAFISGKAKLFDEGNFGMFIHWGLFSNLGGVWEGKTYYGIGEWLMNKRVADIPPKDYSL